MHSDVNNKLIADVIKLKDQFNTILKISFIKHY